MQLKNKLTEQTMKHLMCNLFSMKIRLNVCSQLNEFSVRMFPYPSLDHLHPLLPELFDATKEGDLPFLFQLFQ